MLGRARKAGGRPVGSSSVIGPAGQNTQRGRTARGQRFRPKGAGAKALSGETVDDGFWTPAVNGRSVVRVGRLHLDSVKPVPDMHARRAFDENPDPLTFQQAVEPLVNFVFCFRSE